LVELTKTVRPPEPPKHRAKGGDKVVAAYEAAMEMLRSGHNREAFDAFDGIARRHPRHDYADNALYWKGEAAYDDERWRDALEAFTAVVERYGGGNKAPDALLKIGLCYHRIGDGAAAVDVLGELVLAYPRASASDIARVKLAEIQG
jgi:tol-pal system protein YbgF